jgi:hypothetical protein
MTSRITKKIFTNVSKLNKGVGIGIILENTNSNKITYRLSNECSIFSSETIAILKAIEKTHIRTH